MLIGAPLVAGAGAVAATQTVGGMIEQSTMIGDYQNAQYQYLQSLAPGHNTQAPMPDFETVNRRPQRRVKGGHMGATGDLVFAMHNRR